jgi:hypothetical protein
MMGRWTGVGGIFRGTWLANTLSDDGGSALQLWKSSICNGRAASAIGEHTYGMAGTGHRRVYKSRA